MPGPAALTLETWLGTHSSANTPPRSWGKASSSPKPAIIVPSQEEPLKQSNEHLLRAFTIKPQKTTRGDENPCELLIS